MVPTDPIGIVMTRLGLAVCTLKRPVCPQKNQQVFPLGLLLCVYDVKTEIKTRPSAWEDFVGLQQHLYDYTYKKQLL
jgi:hypothetical protein